MFIIINIFNTVDSVLL